MVGMEARPRRSRERPLKSQIEASPDQLAQEFLRRVPLLNGVADDVVDRVAAALRPVDLPGGEIVCREGDEGTTFNLIESGTLMVETEVGGRRRQLARMGPGDFFGEIALLGGGRRTATVGTLTPTRLWELSVDDFENIVEAEPALRTVVDAMAKERVGRSVANAFDVRHSSLGETLARRGQVSIGRAIDNDIVLPSRTVSNHHAVIRAGDGDATIEDLRSTNGTFVNGESVRRSKLHAGDEVWIGDERFIFEPAELRAVVRPHGVRIDAIALRKDVAADKSLLQDVSLSVLPGEFVALVGGSGAGKTTLLDALAGIRPASGGRVLYDGDDRYEHDARFRTVIGYVPQDDIVHTELSLRRTLHHAAAIRLPVDTTEAAREQAADQVMTQLGLAHQADVKVGRLSGGQRKRCSIGVELLTQPRVFFLDEPTSGLDPAADGQLMRLLRRLADGGSTVVLTTHATKNVAMCDKVVVLGRGGHLAFVGTPARALEHFDVESFDEIYDRLEPEGAPLAAQETFRASPEYEQQRSLVLDPPAPTGSGTGPGRARGLRRSLHQFATLSKRNLDLHLRSKDRLIPMVAQPVVLCFLLLAIFSSGLFKPGRPNAVAPLQIIFLLAFNAFLLGLLASVQEIVKELPIFLRERSVGVSAIPYLLSKTTFLVPAVMLGCVIMSGVMLLTNRLPDTGLEMYGPLLLTMVLAGLAGMALALLTSSFATSSQQATDLLSLWITPQVLFGGGLFAVPSMNFAGRLVSHVVPLRWALEAGGHSAGLNDVFRASQSITGRSLLNQYGDTFSCNPTKQWLILAAFIVLPMTLAGFILRRRSTAR
jgi:ABC-type multidrug transport system ATPase subunit/CRP-like cAMP-binding protein